MASSLSRALLRLVPVLACAAVSLPVPAIAAPAPAPAAASDSSASLAQARPASKRPHRKAKATKAKRSAAATKAADKPKLRPDRGHVDPSRVAAKAKVATGDRLRDEKATRRADPGNLSLTEATAAEIEKLLRGPMRDGTTSLFVADAATGRPVFSVYPDDPLNPASNVKLISTAAALDILGPDYRYRTRLLGTAPDAAGVVDGDLYLLGSYDPTLDRKAMEDLADQLAALGTTRVVGDVVVGATPTRDGIYRSWGEVIVQAAAPGEPPVVTVSSPSELLQLEVTATTAKTKRVRTGGIVVKTELVTDELGRQRMKIAVSGKVGRGKRVARDIFVKERAQHAAHILREALRARGVELTGDVRVAELRDYIDGSIARGFLPMPLVEHLSAPLAQIVARVNKRSTNWLADRVIMTAAAHKYGEKPSMELAIKAMYAWLDRHTGLDRDDLVIDTGSGLSYKTELSARQLVTVLRAALGVEGVTAARDIAVQEAYRASLSVGGVDGTLRGRFKSDALRGHVLGKTGTLHRVIALAGVVEASPDRQLVFAIVSNGHHPRWKQRVRGAQEKLVTLLCDYLHKQAAAEHAAAAVPAVVAPASAPDPLELVEATTDEVAADAEGEAEDATEGAAEDGGDAEGDGPTPEW